MKVKKKVETREVESLKEDLEVVRGENIELLNELRVLKTEKNWYVNHVQLLNYQLQLVRAAVALNIEKKEEFKKCPE
jgi:hypothetical protein